MHIKKTFKKLNLSLHLEESETSPGVSHARSALQFDCLCFRTQSPLSGLVCTGWVTCVLTCGVDRVQLPTALSLSCLFFPKQFSTSPLAPWPELISLSSSFWQASTVISVKGPYRRSSVCLASSNVERKTHQKLPQSAELSDPRRCSHSAPR